MPESRIAELLEKFCASLPYNSRDDVHIDELSDAYRDRREWFRGALVCFDEAVEARNRCRWPITIAVEFFLKPEMQRGGPPEVLDASKLQFSQTPPAVTFYRSGTEPWRTNPGFTELPRTLAPTDSCKLLLFQEWYDEEECDYDRRLWIVSDA